MAAEIIDTFEKRINELDWMSEETKAAAVEKLKAIKISVGYPDYIEGYTNGDFNVRSIEDGGSLMESIISYNAMATRKRRRDNNKRRAGEQGRVVGSRRRA